VVFVAFIALLDYHTGPYLSFGIFYLIPVVVAAWWGGLTHGFLLSVISAVAWHSIEMVENPGVPIGIELWNSIARFCTFVLVSSLVVRLHASIRREQLLARTDPLTGAANGRTFYETVALEADRARRAFRPLTLAYVDLDNFKQLNDRLGHVTGDAALVYVVQVLRANLRNVDMLARLGGDEFALFLPETDDQGARPLLERLQTAVSVEMARKGWQVTASIGAVTFLRPPSDVDQMIQRIDALMYQAKRQGKARVVHDVENAAVRRAAQTLGPLERRATARALCNCSARVRNQANEGDDGVFATVCDISWEGVSVYIDRRFPDGTVLVIEPLAPGSKTLLATTVHATQVQGGWFHGCTLSTHLNEREVSEWLGVNAAKVGC
jgi:diguanylate cyclase (GGDEF)-like protein